MIKIQTGIKNYSIGGVTVDGDVTEVEEEGIANGVGGSDVPYARPLIECETVSVSDDRQRDREHEKRNWRSSLTRSCSRSI